MSACKSWTFPVGFVFGGSDQHRVGSSLFEKHRSQFVCTAYIQVLTHALLPWWRRSKNVESLGNYSSTQKWWILLGADLCIAIVVRLTDYYGQKWQFSCCRSLSRVADSYRPYPNTALLWVDLTWLWIQLKAILFPANEIWSRWIVGIGIVCAAYKSN